MRKPETQKHADSAIALRGPARSTQRPPTAADSPSMTIAIEKITAIWVWLASKRSTRGFLKPEKGKPWRFDRCPGGARGGRGQGGIRAGRSSGHGRGASSVGTLRR